MSAKPKPALYFPAAKLSEAIMQLENARPATLQEIETSAGARSNVKKEIENLKYEIAIYERVIARYEKAKALEDVAS